MIGPVVTVASICFDGFEDADFRTTFAEAPRLGVTDIEFNAWYPRNLTPAGLDSIVARCREAGLRPATLQISPFAPGPEPSDLARETARWMWLFEAARRLGVSIVKATGSPRGQRGGLDAVIALLREIAPIAEESGMTVAVENHAENVIESAADYRAIFDAVSSPAVGMCFDTGHFAASGIDLASIADEFRDRIVHVDLKDHSARAGSFVRFGEGDVDFDAVLSRIVGRGYTGHLVVELPLIDRATMLDDLRAGVALASRHAQRTTTPTAH